MPPALDGDLLELAGESVERQITAKLRAQGERRGGQLGAAQEDGARHHAVGLEQFGEVEAVVRQPVQGEAPPVGFFFEREQDRLTAAVGPFHEQRHVQLPKAIAQTFLELFLPRREDAHPIIRVGRLFRGEKRQGIARIVENQVLEVLVVADRTSAQAT